MNKILLALTILGASAGGFFTARQSTAQRQQEAKATRETWVAQIQLVAVAQSEEVSLLARVRELKQALTQPRSVENALWSALQTNRAGQIASELRERALEELGFNWQSSEEFIVVSKQTLRDIHMQVMQSGKLTDMAATVLAMAPEERAQVETAIQRVQTDFKEWALSNIQRTEPKDDVVAQYTLWGDPALSISNNFAAAVFESVGKERAELIMPSARNWMSFIGIREEPRTMFVKRHLAGNEQRL